MKRAAILVTVAVLVVVFVLLLPTTVTLLSDWWWFSATGFTVVFTKALWMKLLVGLVAGTVGFAFIFGNLWFAQRGVVPDPIVVNIQSKHAARVDVTKGLRTLALPAAAFLGVLIGLSASGAWLSILQFTNATPFGEVDPVFGRDIGYYVFELPAVAGFVAFVQALGLVSLLIVLPLYMLRGDIIVVRSKATVEPAAQMHVGVLAAMLFVASAVGTYLVRIPQLLYSSGGPLFGASYTDLRADLPILRVSGVLAILCAVWVLWGARRLQLVKHLLVAMAVYLGFSALMGALYPSAVQRLVVAPNELARETPQIEHHLEATRRAWGLEGVEVRDLSGEATLTLQDIRTNSGTIKNVRLWDRDPLLQTFGQLQEIRTYYDFVSVDDDRYWIDGEYRQVLLSPRELNSASLPTRTFINERLTFTHGMGVTLSPVNQVTPEGLPYLFVKDLPPTSVVSLSVTRPAIYFGELSNDYVFVNTQQSEFDYPSGDSIATTTYAGTGGVLLSSTLRKLVFSARFQSLKIFLSGDITRDSRVMYHRNIRERAAKALPFLEWDGDPYLVITDDGLLKWILDAYTVSRRYPYSQPLSNGVNYMRNSVKVVVDAYDGSINAYISHAADPVIQTFDRIFPGILQPIEEMPADLRSHIKYPEDLFRAQTALYTIYHMDEPDVFYHREDQWQIPAANQRDASRDPFLRHIVMKLPGQDREEFIFMTPFTPQGKDNLAAWMAARNDGDSYGELVVYRFPRQSLVFGPTQIVNRINQDTEISRQLSLWDQRGSEVIRGNLLVIPIEEALVFVQALYLRAEGGRIPELKRVVVAYQNQVVMEETLDRGLSRLFGSDLAPVVPDMTLPIGDEPLAATAPMAEAAPDMEPRLRALIDEAARRYERAIDAQRNGDWSTYGEEIARVGAILQQIRSITGATEF